jgi:hypothetical protein
MGDGFGRTELIPPCVIGSESQITNMSTRPPATINQSFIQFDYQSCRLQPDGVANFRASFDAAKLTVTLCPPPLQLVVSNPNLDHSHPSSDDPYRFNFNFDCRVAPELLRPGLSRLLRDWRASTPVAMASPRRSRGQPT